MIYVLIIITILLIMPVEFVFTKDETHNDIDIYLTKLFNIRLDFDQMLKLLLTTRENREQVTLKGIKHNYEGLKLARHIIYDISKVSRPKELTFILKVKKFTPELDVISYVLFHNFLIYIKNIIIRYVPRQKDASYNLEYSDKFNFTFKWSLRIRLIYIVLSFIKNYKDVFRLMKYLRKGKKKYGTSSNH